MNPDSETATSMYTDHATVLEEDLRNRIKSLVEIHTQPNMLAWYFSDVVVFPSNDEDAFSKMDITAGEVAGLFSVPGLGQASRDKAINWLMELRNGGEEGMKLLLRCLNKILEKGAVSVKTVTEALLTTLDQQNRPIVWLRTYEYLDKQLGVLDYKGTRDLFKIVLDNIKRFPVSCDASFAKVMRKAVTLLNKISDRKKNLLPAYFIINEVMKLELISNVHWTITPMICEVSESFRPLGQLLSIIGRTELFPIVGECGFNAGLAWKLDAQNLHPSVKGALPYTLDQNATQSLQIFRILSQPSSREVLYAVFALQRTDKLRSTHLEEIFVHNILSTMAFAESEPRYNEWSVRVWQHLSCQLVMFVIFQTVNFPRVVDSLNEQLATVNFRKARDDLMWMLLQYISGGMAKTQVKIEEFNVTGILDLYNLLYSGEEALTITSGDSSSVRAMAPTCLWIHIARKAQSIQQQQSSIILPPIPPSLNTQIKYLQEEIPKLKQFDHGDYMISVLCNAYSTSSDVFTQIVSVLHTELGGPNCGTVNLPGGLLAEGKVRPLSYDCLNSLTIHVRVHLAYHLHNYLTKALSGTKPQVWFSPASVETLNRLLLFPELESQTMKDFISKLLGGTLKAANSSGGQMIELVYILLEMMTFRLPSISSHNRSQALSTVMFMTQSPVFHSNPQIYWAVLNCATFLITSIHPLDVFHGNFPRLMIHLASGAGDMQKNAGLLSENEDMMRIFILILARSVTLVGPYSVDAGGSPADLCREFVSKFVKFFPHGWPPTMLQILPGQIADVYLNSPCPSMNQQQKSMLKQQVDEEIIKWKAQGMNETALFEYFTRQQNQVASIFLCFVWRCLVERIPLSPTIYRIFEHLGIRNFQVYTKFLLDLIVFELGFPANSASANRYIEALNDLIWHFNVLPFERLMTTLILRPYDASEQPIAFSIVHGLLMNCSQFSDRVRCLIENIPVQFWNADDYHSKHMIFHNQFPEAFLGSPMGQQVQAPMPTYFGNCCLRFLPVFDLLICRLIECYAKMEKHVEPLLRALLEEYGVLFRYHPNPVRWAYNTMFVYNEALVPYPAIRRRLLVAIYDSQVEMTKVGHQEKNFSFVTHDFIEFYCAKSIEAAIQWIPDLEYYRSVVDRLINVCAIPSKPFLSVNTWQFGEFALPSLYMLHSVCCELMGLPVAPKLVGTALVELVAQNATCVDAEDFMSLVNALATIIAALPHSYSEGLFTAILKEIETDPVAKSTDILQELDVLRQFGTLSDVRHARIMALAHATFQHHSTGYAQIISDFLRKQCLPIVKTESQFLYVAQLIGPLLARYYVDKSSRTIFEIAVIFYEMLLAVDKNSSDIELKFEDVIVDWFYHLKYQYIGDYKRDDISKIIPQLRQSLQRRCRYISHLNVESAPSQAMEL